MFGRMTGIIENGAMRYVKSHIKRASINIANVIGERIGHI